MTVKDICVRSTFPDDAASRSFCWQATGWATAMACFFLTGTGCASVKEIYLPSVDKDEKESTFILL